MADLPSSHAFGSMAKIDPNSVINSIKDNVHAKEFKEVTIMNGDDAKHFTPMQWPLFDDGKPVSTNAIGYEVGGYFKRHQEAMRAAQLEAERKAEEERIEAEREAQRQAEEAAKPQITVEELEAIRTAARNEGFTEGLSQGHEEGYAKGLEQGQADGFTQGQKEGMEQGYQDGFKQGRDEGFTKGQEAGIASGSDMVTTQADRFRHLADMLANPIREVDEKVTDEIIYIVSRLAKVILKREIKGDVEFLKHAIEKSLSLIPDSKNGAEIQLSENDYALMVAAIGRDYMAEQGWDLKPAENMEDGDIIVNTKTSSVQWRVNDRIDSLINDFLVSSADVVSSARKEVIEGAPDYNEVPKKQIIPPRDILGMSERIEKNMSEMAPSGAPVSEESETLSAALAGEPMDTPENVDIDAAELEDASLREETDDALRTTADAIDAGATIDPNGPVDPNMEMPAEEPIPEANAEVVQQ